MRIEIRDFFQVLYGCSDITRLKRGASTQEQRIAVPGVELQHPLQNLFRRRQLSFGAQVIRRRSENLPGLSFLIKPDVNLGQPNPHGHVFRIHFQSLLENPNRLLQLSRTQEFFSYMQILSAGIVEQALLRVQLRQPKHPFQGRFDLRQLLVHGDCFDRETLAGISVADFFEALEGPLILAKTGVKIAYSVRNGQILGVSLQNLLVLSDSILQLSLLDILLRRAESLLFVESETKRHMSANSGL